MSEEKRPFRDAFLERLKTRFYEELKEHEVLSEWDATDLWDLADKMVQQKQSEINSYLDHNKVTLKGADFAMKEIIREILMPEIDSLRI
jgi:hypothetical protein